MSDCCNTTGTGFPNAGDMANMAMNWPVVWAEIAAIQQAILKASSQCPVPCGGQGGMIGTGGLTQMCIGGNTPMTFTTGIADVIVVDGGIGYYTDTPAVYFTPPFGVTPSVLATGTVTTNGSQVISIAITNGGADYTAVETTATVSSVTGSGAQLLVTVGPSGSLYGITVLNPGTGYLPTDAVNIIRALAPNVAYINANAVIGGLDLTGGIVGVNVLNPGTGYGPSVTTATIVSSLNSSVPYITGTGFQSSVLTGVGGEISGVIISYGGQGYTNLPPQLVISDVGTGALTKVNLNGTLKVPPGNSVSTIDVIESGSNYTENAVLQVINPPTAPAPTTPAVVRIAVPENPYCTNSNLYYQVWAGTVTNSAVQAQIDFVKSYFVKLGYKITIGTNPETGSTLLWCLCW